MTLLKPAPAPSTETGPSRRTIITTAAWVAPVIATSMATPALAASGETVALALSPRYSSIALGGQAELTLTCVGNGGASVASRDVIVTLPSGFTIGATGLSTTMLTTDSAGLARFTVTAGTTPSTGTVTAVLTTDSSVTATADIEAGIFLDQSPRAVTIIGVADKTTDGPDEFRADFAIVVATGDRPTKMEYNYYPHLPTSFNTLTKIDDIQKSIDQNWSIVTVQDLGDGREVLWCSARGDADVAGVAETQTYTNYVRATWSDKSTTQGGYTMQNVTRNNTTGRPVMIQAWDTTVSSSTPGYVGPNAQAGWGNYVPAGSSAPLQGGKFHVDSLNSGRRNTVGNDVTDTVYVQFVRGDNGRPASVTPNPVPITIKNNSGTVAGVLLASTLGSFELDAPGYYRLVAWPQTSSSLGTATQDSAGVAYDYRDLSQATQIGSVFWKIPTGAN